MKIITSTLISLLFLSVLFLSNCKKESPAEYYFSEASTQHLSSENGIPNPSDDSEIKKESYGIRFFLSRELY